MRTVILSGLILSYMPFVGAQDFPDRQKLLADLVIQLSPTIKSYDPATGRFGTGVWDRREQQDIFALAVAYTTSGAGNIYYRNPKVLEMIVGGGDALIRDMDEKGCFARVKKDGSYWGRVRIPWTYSRWIRTFGLIRDVMPTDRRQAWANALQLGYEQIARYEFDKPHNIPTHHAMGLYAAGKIFDRPEWCRQGTEFMAKVIAVQAPGGYWSEGGGPVVLYNLDYLEPIATYYLMSGDPAALAASIKAINYHIHFTYPSGQDVETIDQRNPFNPTVDLGNVGMTLSAEGRTHLANLFKLMGRRPPADLLAQLILHGSTGPMAAAADSATPATPFVLRDEQDTPRAMTFHQGPWFVVLSAFTSPIATSRWHQDRQNLVSIWHEKTGLILGGGNTKLQPGWSSFTVGDEQALTLQPGSSEPVFLPKGTLFHVPSTAALDAGQSTLDLTYGQQACRVTVQVRDARSLVYHVERRGGDTMLPVLAHLTLLPQIGKPLTYGGNHTVILRTDALNCSPAELGGSLRHGGFKLSLPAAAALRWPVLPHNPYRKDGHAEASEGRIEIRIPLPPESPAQDVLLQIEDPS